MQGVTVGQIRHWVGGQWQGVAAADVTPMGINTDTRHLRRGEMFLALRGPNFDGNQFVEEAFDRGACAAVLDSSNTNVQAGRPVVVVDDGLKALGEIAKHYRRRFELPVVAIAGSSGKTTTKEMVASVLGRSLRVLKTPDSENNEIGVPSTLLQLSEEYDAAVVELAARRVGDIRYLCEIAQPTIGVLLNIGTAHLEYFETVERVAKAKGELLDYIGDESSLALVNVDDCVVAKEAKRTKGRLLGFGLDRESHYSGEGLVLDQEGCGHFSLQNIQIDLKIPGKHNVYNALAAAAVGDQCGIVGAEIGAALNAFEPRAMRSEVLRKNGICIINDCYNANPGSGEAALNLLKDMKLGRGGRRVAVLGDMLELGQSAPDLHAELGRQAHRVGVNVLLTNGYLARFTEVAAREAGLKSTCHFERKADLVAGLCSSVQAGDVVLIKASRMSAFEEVCQCLIMSL